MYDIFVVGKKDVDRDFWLSVKRTYPNAQLIENCKDLKTLSKKSFTKMFWVLWDDVNLDPKFDLYSYRATVHDDMYVHVFLNNTCYDGICLFPKNNSITQREYLNRFFIDKKEISINASSPNRYDKFYISNYDEYLEAMQKSSTPMFYAVWNDIIITDFDFDFQVPFWNQHITHVFKNGEYFDGICLFSKFIQISKKEFDNRFFINKIEVDKVVSKPKDFEKFNIDTYEQYLECVEKSSTNMFYVIWNDLIIDEEFNFSYQIPRFNQHIPHVFRNKNYYDGICVLPKTVKVSRREIENRFFIEKKEIDVIASRPKLFEKFVIETFEDYQQALTRSSTNMFWAVWNDLYVSPDFTFDYQVPYYNQHITYVFKNGEHRDGICIFSKNTPISSKEFSKRYFVEKIELDEVASFPKKQDYDIIFISYNEINADENFKDLSSKYPRAKRIHGVKGIHNAHIQAAKLAQTEMFYVVDGDAVIVDDFYFDYCVPKYERSHVHVWRSRNPLNNLEYGYGGVKLLPREKTINMDINSLDMTTSISNNFKVMKQVSNITVFNTDAFSTWKSAFRECAKLSSQTIARQDSDETLERLDIWCNIANGHFGYYAIQGAMAGRKYGEQAKGNIESIKKINDFEWLKKHFDETQQKP